MASSLPLSSSLFLFSAVPPAAVAAIPPSVAAGIFPAVCNGELLPACMCCPALAPSWSGGSAPPEKHFRGHEPRVFACTLAACVRSKVEHLVLVPVHCWAVGKLTSRHWGVNHGRQGDLWCSKYALGCCWRRARVTKWGPGMSPIHPPFWVQVATCQASEICSTSEEPYLKDSRQVWQACQWWLSCGSPTYPSGLP